MHFSYVSLHIVPLTVTCFICLSVFLTVCSALCLFICPTDEISRRVFLTMSCITINILLVIYICKSKHNLLSEVLDWRPFIPMCYKSSCPHERVRYKSTAEAGFFKGGGPDPIGHSPPPQIRYSMDTEILVSFAMILKSERQLYVTDRDRFVSRGESMTAKEG